MKPNFAHYLYAAVLAAVITSGPVGAQTAPPSERLTHRPMELQRNADGSVKRGLRNTIQTGYWSGFAATAAAPYSSAAGTFQVPRVSYSGSGHSYEDSALWVGVGGDGDSTLIQLGTEQLVTSSSAASYYVWYELYPAATVYLGHTVNPGDIITASLQCTAACSPSSAQTWQLTMTNQTAGWTWTQSVQYQSSMASAEWITEAPWDSSGELPLDDFVQATFDPVFANGANPNLTLASNGIQMADPYGETSNPSDPVGGNVFSTCWGLAPSYTPCTAGSFTTPPPATTASLSAYPTKVSPGQASTLTWSSTNASSCMGGGFTASGTSGKAVAYPPVTTSYSVTCTGNGASATSLAAVTVSSPKTCQRKHC
jgi:Peptidase A4 family